MSHRFVEKMLKNCAGLCFLIAIAFGTSEALAADVTWKGNYRFEGVKIQGSELNSDRSDKAYMLQHLVLSPELVAADGLKIYSRLDVLNDPTFGIDNNGRVYSVAGDVIGKGPGTTPAGTGVSRGSETNSWGRTQRAGLIAVTALYGTWTQEFGQLIVGRAPIHFGLGTAFNAGTGAFDHFIDTKDMVGYKFVVGNLFILPIMGKVSEGDLGHEDEVDDYIVHLQYENPETELSLGFLYDIHVVTGNDAPDSGIIGGAGAQRTGSYKSTLMSFFLSQKAGSRLRANVEADLLSGDTGLRTSNRQGVGLNSFGLAGEFVYLPPADSKWGGNFKLGLASGDDPGTADVYEGFQFNRNYDVGLLLFNHPLGRQNVDFLRSGTIRDVSVKPSSQIDNEAISNVLYFAPSVSYRSRDSLTYGASFIYGILNKDPIGAGSGTALDLGYEIDFSVTYKPFARLTWITEAGLLLPGDAWKGGTNQYENKMAYGFVTKAAITF